MRYSALDEPVNNREYLPHIRKISTSVLWGGIYKSSASHMTNGGPKKSTITNQTGGAFGPIAQAPIGKLPWIAHDSLTLIAQLLSGTTNGRLKE
jgi:hypothetical protein